MCEKSILYGTCVAAGTARTALACCIIVAAGLPLSQGRAGEELIRPMGYLTHPFFGDMPSLAGTEATAQLANIFVWRTITPEPQALDEVQQDFASAEAWLTELYENQLHAFPILDTAIHHSNMPWRAAMTRKVGENLTTYSGTDAGFSSLHSPHFRRSVFHYIDQLIDWVCANDTERRIPAYVNGAEWFYPGMLDYHDLAVAAFRDWLRERYSDVGTLNAAWGAGFESFDKVCPPRPRPAGLIDHGLRTYIFQDSIDAGWMSPAAEVTPGHVYEGTTTISSAVPEYLATLQYVWLDQAGGVRHMDSFGLLDGPPLTGRAECPAEATRVQMVVKLAGPGSLRFTTPSLRSVTSDAQLFDDAEWSFTVWNGDATGTHDAATGEFHINTPPAVLPFEHTSVAVEDWITFSYEAMAQWLNQCALHIKERDPTRLVTSYVGFVFASHCCWDYAMDMQRLDISLANSPGIDINAIQVCAAAGDLAYPAFPLDMARKYGKPVWSYDLVDFPYGLHSGFETIYRASMASIQHGSRGILYCEWNGAPYDYLYSVCLPSTDRERMLRESKLAMQALEGYALHTNVAQLTPLMSYSIADQGGRKGDMLDHGGLYGLVLDMGFLPDVFTPYEVSRRGRDCFRDYDVLFLSDCPVLPRDVHGTLATFIQGGGVLVASGRLPEIDLAGLPLEPSIPSLAAAFPGRVVHQGQAIGRAYWGRVDRVRKYGNTPPVFLESRHTPQDPDVKRAIRHRLADALEASQAPWPVRLGVEDGQVHVAHYVRAVDGSPLLFLVHQGRGRSVGTRIVLDSHHPQTWTAIIDFDRPQNVERDEDGALRLPDFAHTCIVRPRD